MEVPQSRILFKFSVDGEVEKEVKETLEQNGEQVEITKKVKTTEPVEFIIRKPKRTELEDGDMFYSVKINEYIKQGLLTKAMIAKRYGDNGGNLTDEEKEYYGNLYFEIFKAEQELVSSQSSAETEEERESEARRLTSKISNIRRELMAFEQMQASLFDHTADVKARQATITWYLLQLLMQKGKKDGHYEYFFKGDGYKERHANYLEVEDVASDFQMKVVEEAAKIISIWYFSSESNPDKIQEMLDSINAQ